MGWMNSGASALGSAPPENPKGLDRGVAYLSKTSAVKPLPGIKFITHFHCYLSGNNLLEMTAPA